MSWAGPAVARQRKPAGGAGGPPQAAGEGPAGFLR